MDPYLGEIRMFAGNYAPQDWVLCNGALLSISQYQALYALLGTAWGGDGISTFGAPDLRGRLPVGQGTGQGLTPRRVAQTGGTETVTLNATMIPAHNHAFNATSGDATAIAPGPALMFAKADTAAIRRTIVTIMACILAGTTVFLAAVISDLAPAVVALIAPGFDAATSQSAIVLAGGLAWLSLAALIAAGAVMLYENGRAMTRLAACLSLDGSPSGCDAITVPSDPRGAELGLATLIESTVPVFLQAPEPMPARQLALMQLVLLTAEQRDREGRSLLLSMALANADAAMAFTPGGDRLLPPGETLAEVWPRVLQHILARAPRCLDVLTTYFNWLLLQGRPGDMEAMLGDARSIDPDHPVVLWFTGAALIDQSDPVSQQRGLALMRQALAAGLERFMPVDDTLKARLAGSGGGN